MAKAKRNNKYRMALQWTVFGLLVLMLIRPLFDRSYIADIEAYCPFGGIQAFGSYLASNTLACTMTTSQIGMGLALIAGIFLFSKLFCSHICPIGTFTEWLGRLGRKYKMNFVVTGIADRLLRVLKYGLLFVTVFYTVTDSELFCRIFDPYYAVFSGFGHDVVPLYAGLALLLVIPGSFFVRQLWCKYLCPLSAASNIFTYGIVFLGLIGLYAVLVLVFGLAISWVWLLAALSIAGMLLETTRLGSRLLPLVKVTRNADTCTSCRICDKACPMAIRISDQPRVDHIDCHLCGDCVAKCPEPDTLNYNRRNMKWLPATATILLIAIGITFAAVTDIPTISLKWGDEQQMAKAAVYQQSGLKNVKCYGSSMSFATHMESLPGVLGVETFVSGHSVKVYYDPEVLDDNAIREAIFTPVSRIFAAPETRTESVAVAEFLIDQFFDPLDSRMLTMRFGQTPGIYAMETRFGEPVHAVVYFDPRRIDAGRIKSLIEEKKTKWEVDGKQNEARTNFRVAGFTEKEAVPLAQYLSMVYEPIAMDFNSTATTPSDSADTLLLPFAAAAEPELADMPWYLLSHISNNPGVTKFEVVPGADGFSLRLCYLPKVTDRDEIMEQLNAPQLKVHMSDGTEQMVDNPFRF